MQELVAAAAWIAEDNPASAHALLDAALRAAAMIVANPALARRRPELAPPRFRFWPLRGFRYLPVLDAAHEPPVIARVVHQARDLPVALGDLES